MMFPIPQRVSYTIIVASIVAILVAFAVICEGRRDKKLFRRIVRIYEYDNCKSKPPRPYRLTQRKIYTPAKNVYALDAEGTCERATKSLKRVVTILTKCADRTKIACEYSHRMEWKSSATICSALTSTIKPWWSFLKAHSPPLLCHNQVGNFTIRNMTVGVAAVSGLQAVGDQYWIAEWEIYDDKMAPIFFYTLCVYIMSVKLPINTIKITETETTSLLVTGRPLYMQVIQVARLLSILGHGKLADCDRIAAQSSLSPKQKKSTTRYIMYK